ncbi:MAG: CPBP family glutamic-type intramembrane protease [Anaerolineae bacterium]
MRTLFEFIAVVSVGVLPAVLGSVMQLSRPEVVVRMTAGEQLLNRGLRALMIIAVVMLVALDQPGGLTALGMPRANNESLVATMWGLIVMGGALWIYVAVRTIVSRLRPNAAAAPAPVPPRPWLASTTVYRSGWERVAFLVVLAFTVIAEDLVFRGYLVLWWGARTGTFIPWAVLSVALSVLVHLYQGRGAPAPDGLPVSPLRTPLMLRTILFHAGLAGLFVGVTVVTHNLAAAIVPHLWYDIVWTVGVWRRDRGA